MYNFNRIHKKQYMVKIAYSLNPKERNRHASGKYYKAM